MSDGRVWVSVHIDSDQLAAVEAWAERIVVSRHVIVGWALRKWLEEAAYIAPAASASEGER